MHHIHKITDLHLICLDDEDFEYTISREHFEQWLSDTGRDTSTTYAPEYSNHVERDIQIDWYELCLEDKSHDLKAYCREQREYIIASINAQQIID
jgi:hypothetical protein